MTTDSDQNKKRLFVTFSCRHKIEKASFFAQLLYGNKIKRNKNFLYLPHNCNVEIAKMNNTIKHEGTIERIEGGIAYVKIIQLSACSGCHAKSACSIADQQEKIIETVCSGYDLKPGDRVWVNGSEAMSREAIRLSVIYPFFCLFGMLCIAYALSVNELLSGILSIGVLIPYYIVLYFRRSKIKKDFIFTLEKV